MTGSFSCVDAVCYLGSCALCCSRSVAHSSTAVLGGLGALSPAAVLCLVILVCTLPLAPTSRAGGVQVVRGCVYTVCSGANPRFNNLIPQCPLENVAIVSMCVGELLTLKTTYRHACCKLCTGNLDELPGHIKPGLLNGSHSCQHCLQHMDDASLTTSLR